MRRIAVRLARADTNTPVTEWLKMRIPELFEWVSIVSEEAKLMQREIERQSRKGR